MASLDLASFGPAVKQLYPEKRVLNMAYNDHPFFAMVKKNSNFVGDPAKVAVKYGTPQGSGPSFAVAQANKTASSMKAFLVTRSKEYALASIDNETILASRDQAGALIDALSFEIDGAIETCSRNIAIGLYGSGSGSRGQVLAGTTGTSITLKNIDDVVKFEPGMELQFSTTDGGGSVKAGTITLLGVDRDSGILTVDAASAIASGAGVATDDYIFRAGSYDLSIKGLSAWIPATAPTSSPFFTVDRSVDPTRLGGIRVDGSAMPIEEALITAANRVAREGGNPDTCFINYSKYSDLIKALGSKVTYVNPKASNAEIGFRGVAVDGPRGVISVIPDQDCPSDRAFMLSMNTWTLGSLKQCPHILDLDGNKALRDSAADALEIRVGAYLQLYCVAPGYNANIKLA